MLILDDSDECPLVLNSTALWRDSAGTLMLMYDAENWRKEKKHSCGASRLLKHVILNFLELWYIYGKKRCCCCHFVTSIVKLCDLEVECSRLICFRGTDWACWNSLCPTPVNRRHRNKNLQIEGSAFKRFIDFPSKVLSFSLPPSLSLCLWLSVSLSPCFCLSVCLSLSLSLSLPPLFLSLCLCVSLSAPLSLHWLPQHALRARKLASGKTSKMQLVCVCVCVCLCVCVACLFGFCWMSVVVFILLR